MNADTLTHTKKGQQSNEGGISCPLYILHPVSQKKKKVYRTDQTTFILGETPKGIRRYAVYKSRNVRNVPCVTYLGAKNLSPAESTWGNITSDERQ